MRRHFHTHTSLLYKLLTKNHLIQQLKIPTIAINPQIIKDHNFYSTNIEFHLQKSDLSPTNKRVVDDLITIFINKKFEENQVELSQLGAQLTPEIVEFVLRGIRNWRIAFKFYNWAKNQDGYFHNCYSYNAMASILASVRQNAAMKSLVVDVMSSCCYMSPGALGYLIRCLGSVGLVQDANLLFDHVRKAGVCVPNSYTYNCLLEAIAKSNSSELAERRLDEMRGFGWTVDKYTLTPLLRVYCNAGEFDKALLVFNQILEKGWVDGLVLSILVLSFSKWGDVDRAFELIERMEECSLRLNEKTFYVLIHGFVSSCKVDKALQLFEKMCGSGFVPDIAVYDVLIGGLCKRKEVQKALRLYSEMKSSGMSTDVGILSKLISSVSEEEVMAQLLEESGEGLVNESVKLLYVSVLNGLVSNGLTDRALQLVKTMMEDTPQNGSRLEKFFKCRGILCLDSSSFSIIINGLCQKGKLDEALQLFKTMDNLRCSKDTMLYNNLIDALCKADRIMDGLDLLGEMKKSGTKPTHFTYNSIYGYFCRKGDVTGATSIVKEMCVYHHEPWIKHSTTLVIQLCKYGRAVEASDFLAEMVQEGLVPHLVPYSAAMGGFCKLKDVDRALELFHSVCARGYRPDIVAYNILINGLCKANRMSEADNMLKEMLAGGLVPSTVTYNSLIDGWCKNGNIDQALVFFSGMAGEDRAANAITYTTLIDGLCNAGRPDDALMLWNEMEGKGCSPNRITFMALISGLSKNDMPDTALFYLREMEKKELRADSFVYVALMESFLANEKPALALDILKEIVDKKMFPDPADKNHKHVTNVIAKLVEDPLTSRNVNELLAKGGIPTVSCLELNSEAET